MRNHWRRMATAFAVSAACLWLPFSWLIFINYPWNNYHLYWLKLWPILPGLIPVGLPAHMMNMHPAQSLGFIAMGITTLLLLIGFTWLGSRGWIWLIVAALIELSITIPSAFSAYALFRA